MAERSSENSRSDSSHAAETTGLSASPQEQGKDLTTKAYEAIRDAIIRNLIYPGEQLKERTLQERFGFSRTPIRAALKRLVDEGFAQSVPKVGVFVRRVSVGELKEQVEFRRIIESGAAAMAALKAGDGELDELAGLGASLDAYERKHDMAAAFHHEILFHRKVLMLADNHQVNQYASSSHMVFWILGVYEFQKRLSKPIFVAEDAPKGYIWHEDLGRIIASRNPDKAFSGMWNHIAYVMEQIESELAAQQV